MVEKDLELVKKQYIGAINELVRTLHRDLNQPIIDPEISASAVETISARIRKIESDKQQRIAESNYSINNYENLLRENKKN